MTRSRIAVVVASLLVAVQGPAWGQTDWPGFRGPGRNGVAVDAKPPVEWGDEKNVTWKVALPGPGSSSPIVVGNRVYVTCYSGYGNHLDDGGEPKDLKHHVVCLERGSGKIVWDRVVPGPLAKEARRVQITEHGFASPTPICDGDALYVYFGRAGLLCLGLDGKVRWQAELGQPSKDASPATNSVVRKGQALDLHWGAGSSPLLYQDLVIVNCSEESHSVRAFEKKTGKLRWKRESSNLEGCATSPVVVGQGEDETLVISLAGEVWGLTPKSGELRWKVETGTRGGLVPTPVADAELVYVFGGQGESYALRFKGKGGDPKKRVAWKSSNVGIPSATLHEGRLFLVQVNGTAHCLSAKDGKSLHKGRLEGRARRLYASPLIADGRIYVVTRKGGTYVYAADGKFSLLSHNKLEDKGQFNASPALSGDQMFLRSDTHLYCLASSS